MTAIKWLAPNCKRQNKQNPDYLMITEYKNIEKNRINLTQNHCCHSHCRYSSRKIHLLCKSIWKVYYFLQIIRIFLERKDYSFINLRKIVNLNNILTVLNSNKQIYFNMRHQAYITLMFSFVKFYLSSVNSWWL